MGFSDVADGSFWMEGVDFVEVWDTMAAVGAPPPDTAVRSIEGAWTAQSAGGCGNANDGGE